MIEEIGDRTNRFARLFLEHDIDVLGAFRQFSVGLTGNSKLLQTLNGQVMALTVINLMSRFHPEVNIDVSQEFRTMVWVPFGNDDRFVGCLANMATLVGSKTKLEPAKDLDVLISVGRTETSAKYKININSDGWLAFTNDSDERIDFVSENQNPIGAQTAACFGVADAFRRLLFLLGCRERRVVREPAPLVFSTLEYSANDPTARNPSMPQKIDIDEVVVVGAGAVANGLVYAIATIPHAFGTIKVIDYQSFEETNINRCLMVCLKHVGANKAKALASCQFRNLKVIAFPTTYEEFIKTHVGAKLDLVISTVDNNDTRIRVQSDLPRIVLHGATGEHVATISRHSFVEGACLGCLFFEQISPAATISTETGISVHEVEQLLCGTVQVTKEHMSAIATRTGIDTERLRGYIDRPFIELYTQEICGTIRPKVGGKEIAASVSFVSALPGVLLAGEIIKERSHELSRFRLNNYLTLSLFNPAARWPLQRPKDERCMCMCAHPIMQGAYRVKWPK